LDPWGSENGPSESNMSNNETTSHRISEPEGDGRASTTFDFRVYSFQDPKG